MSQSPSERNTTFQLKRALKAEDECRELQAKIIKMEASIAAARVQENERCLALMDAIGCDWRDAGDMAKFYAANYLREAIRALLGKEAQS